MVIVHRTSHVLFVALFFCCGDIARAYPAFRDEIPNGLRSGDYHSEVIRAIGHLNPSGGGALNEFGSAFLKAGAEWTKELCQVLRPSVYIRDL